MSDEQEQRLERMEKKLDNVANAIVALARMEERMISLFKRTDKQEENQEKLALKFETEQEKQSERITKVENKTGSNGQSLRFAERVFWIVLAASVTFLIKFSV